MPEFRNPNAGGAPSQDNRSFLVMLLVMMGVVFGIQYWHMRTAPPAPANRTRRDDSRNDTGAGARCSRPGVHDDCRRRHDSGGRGDG